VPLTADEQAKITARLEQKTGRKIILVSKVDPSTLGGMIVLVEGEIIDGSVRHGLDQIRDQLDKVKVH
jgi:F-type H+-transporting ATPase subunit delta